MKYLSVCSGIEAASVAWEPLGWRPLAFSEIEPFPRALLAHRFPGVRIEGDFTLLRDEPWIVDADLLVGGTPCQAFSVAGLRRSLADDRGNLSLEFVRLADAIDDLRLPAGRPAAIILWENVPGVLSTGDNAFGCFLAALVGEETPLVPARGQRWTDAGVVAGPRRAAAWRVLDAQYFSLAQRRRRVFVVASARDDAHPAEVLFEPSSLFGHPAPSRQAGQRASRPNASGARGGSGYRHDADTADNLTAGTIDAAAGRSRGAGTHPGMLANTLRVPSRGATWRGDGADNLVAGDEPAPALANSIQASAGHHGYSSPRGDGGDNLIVAGTIGTGGRHTTGLKNEADVLVAATLTARSSRGRGQTNSPGFNSGTLVVAEPLAVDLRNGVAENGPAHTLQAGHDCHSVPHAIVAVDLYNGTLTGDIACTMGAAPGGTTIGPSIIAFGGNNTGGLPAFEAVPILEPGRRSGKSTDDPKCGIGIGEPGDPMFTLNAERPHGILAFGGNNTSGPIEVSSRIGDHGGPHGRQDFETDTFIVVGALQASGKAAGSCTQQQDAEAGMLIPIFAQELADPIIAGEQKTWTHEGSTFRTRNLIAFDATQITHPENRSNPQPGDPAPTLAKGARPPAIAFSCKDHGADAGDDLAPTLRGMVEGEGNANGGGQVAVAISGGHYAYAQEARPAEALRALREAVGAEAFRQWCLGVVASLLPPEILQPALHEHGIRRPTQPKRGVVGYALSCAQAGAGGPMPNLWEAGCDGRAPQGWRPPEQLARQLGAHLSQLPYAPSPAQRFLHDLRSADEGAGLLQPALSAIQEAWESIAGEGPARGIAGVRRLTVAECEALQGFPRGYTLIPYRGALAADGPRYRAIGNSMAVPCMFWLGRRIALVLGIHDAGQEVALPAGADLVGGSEVDHHAPEDGSGRSQCRSALEGQGLSPNPGQP